MKKLVRLPIFAFFIFSATFTFSQDWTLTDSVYPTPYLSSVGDNYGSAVDIFSDYAVVGASQDSENGTGSGAAYVLYKSDTGWVNVAKLMPTSPSSGDLFGFSVSISDTVVVVGAPGYGDSGSVFVFVKPTEGWTHMTQTVILSPSDGAADDQFGASVSIDETTIAVGARYDDDNGDNSGSVYVFNTSTGDWADFVELAKILPSDGEERHYFGNSVAVHNDEIVVGAFGDEEGSAYVFEMPDTGWAVMNQDAKLTSSDGLVGDFFGYSVAIYDDQILVGASGNDELAEGAGAGYIFERPANGWANSTETAKLTASDAAANDLFGLSVALTSTAAVIGSYADDDNGSNSGSVYVYNRPGTGWINSTQSGKLTASDGTDGDNFGVSVAISMNEVLTGARYFGNNEVQSGAVYFIERPGGSWTNTTSEALGFSEPYLSNSNDQFGSAVSIDGDFAVVGAPNASDSLSAWGSVYVLENTGSAWEKIARLAPSDSVDFKFFGASVSISGDVIVVGAPGSEQNSVEGKTYVFERPIDGWKDTVETAVLLPALNSTALAFGSSVKILGSDVVVSADFFDNGSGQVFVFEEPVDGWDDMNETAVLSNSDNLAYDRFGSSIGISSNTIVVGAPFQTGIADSTGAVYVFEKPVDGWATATQTAKLISEDGENSEGFGRSVSIDNDQIAVGAPLKSVEDFSTGMVYVFERDGDIWSDMTATAKLNISDIGHGKLLGQTVYISGDYILAGAPGDENEGGAAYSYIKPQVGWVDSDEHVKIENQSGAESFGNSLAISGNYLIVGASQNDADGSNSGATYILRNLNSKPTFELGESPISVLNAGPQEFESWATEISDGGNNTQGLTFLVTNDNNALFTTQPSIDQNGTLAYESATDGLGDVQVSVWLMDDGGIEGGAQDTSDEMTFTIRIVPINIAPSFTTGADQSVDEDAEEVIVENWANNISDGGDESQALSFIVINDNPGLFQQQPEIDNSGTLVFEAAEDANGIAMVTVSLMDDGGTELGGSDTSTEEIFSITVNPINDAPSISFIFDQEMESGGDTLTVEYFVEDVDDNLSALEFSASAAVPELIAANGFIFGGEENERSLSVVSSNEVGETDISIVVSDGELSYTRTFELDIDPIVASISKSEFSQSLTLFPNPATDQLSLKLPSDQFLTKISLFNQDGKKVKILPTKEGKSEFVFTVNNLPNGIYVLMVETHETIGVVRFVKI